MSWKNYRARASIIADAIRLTNRQAAAAYFRSAHTRFKLEYGK